MNFRAVAILLCVVLSCAGSKKKQPESYLIDISATHPDHPTTRSICALGVHETSQERALANARAGVSRQVQSRIESLIEDILVIKDQDGRVSEREDYESRTRQFSAFDHNELILPVGSAYWQDNHRVYACMNRQEAAQTIRQDIQADIDGIIEAHRLGIEAAENNATGPFSVQYREAREKEPAARAGHAQIRVILRQPDPSEPSVKSALQELRQRAKQLRAAAELGLHMSSSDLPADLQTQVLGELRQGISRLGLGVGQDAPTCAAAPSLSHLVLVESSKRCRRGHLGTLCEPSLSLSLTECATNSVVGRHLFEEESWRAASTRDQETTLRKSLSQVTADSLLPGIRALLETELPLD
jgi:hypothetical protein